MAGEAKANHHAHPFDRKHVRRGLVSQSESRKSSGEDIKHPDHGLKGGAYEDHHAQHRGGTGVLGNVFERRERIVA